jgi:hypothetical protein
MLGSPIGSEAFCQQYLLDKFETKYMPLFPQITKLKHPHAAWRMWKILNVSSGLTHIFRTTPTKCILGVLPQIEKKMRQFLGEAVFGCTFTEQEWAIVQFPFDLGGWNVIPLEILAACGYLASILANKTAIVSLRPNSSMRIEKEIQETIALIYQICPKAKLPELNSSTKQRELVRACMEPRLEDFLAKADQRTKALLRGQQQEHASKWKHAAHTAETFMPGELFQISARYSIGKPIPFTEKMCPCCQKRALDPFGDHALICMTTGDVVHRHNDLFRPLVAEARSGMIGLSVEETLHKTETSTYRPDFIISRGIPGFCDEPVGLDMVVTCPLNKTLISKAAKQDLASAMVASDRKDKEQKEDLEKINYGFMPLALETTGGHSKEVATLVHFIAKEKQLMTGIPFGENATYLWELLSVTLQRANAFAIKKRYFETLPDKEVKESRGYSGV